MSSRAIPRVSVVMSVYNGERYLRDAVDSILGQTFADFEFIIVNDGSNDRTEEILTSYREERVKLIVQQNQGLAKALNNAIRIAEGEFIARMDADDVSRSNRIERQVEFMQAHPECVCLGTNVTIMDEQGENLYTTDLPLNDSSIRVALMHQNPFVHGSVMYRKQTFSKVGGYHEEIKHYIEDDLLWLDFASQGEFGVLAEPLYCYRINPGSINMLTRAEKRRLRRIRVNYLKDSNLRVKDVEYINNLSTHRSSKIKKALYAYSLAKAHIHYRKDWTVGRKYLRETIKAYPFHLPALLNYFCTFLASKHK